MPLTPEQETEFYLQLSMHWAKQISEIDEEYQQVEWLFSEVERQIRQFEQSAPSSAFSHIDCKKGCSDCCSLPVKTLPSIARYIVRQFSAEQKATLKPLLVEYEHRKVKVRQSCPLLKEHSCSIYAYRPLACRTFTSPDVGLCKTNLIFTTQIPQQAFRYQTYQAAMVALQAVAKKRGEPYEDVEFVAAMLEELE